MARPSTYLRGLHSARSYLVRDGGVFISTYSTTVVLLSGNSTGVVSAGGVKVSNAAGGQLTANSTALTAPALRLGTTAVYITRNSTGYKIGARYISTNTTGNLVT